MMLEIKGVMSIIYKILTRWQGNAGPLPFCNNSRKSNSNVIFGANSEGDVSVGL